jgi:LuxR family transcriptional regulator, maltose regulon positive regulatory protein
MERPHAEVQLHKLCAPSSPAGAIQRTAILNQVFAPGAPGLVLLQGPAGHGKSTTLLQLKASCEARGYQTGWYALDDTDNDARRFSLHFQTLIATLTGAQSAASTDGAAAADSTWSSRHDWLRDRLYHSGRPVAVFLDDFQCLTNKAILTFCRKAFERLPSDVRLFVASRALPEIGLARLLVTQQALLLRAEDLRFSYAEVERFFAAPGGSGVSSDEIQAIYSRSEGWPAALQLFKLSLASPLVRSSLGDVASNQPRELADYLADNVLALQSPQMQDFLLRTSLLTRLTAPLCDAVTGRANSQQVLQELERCGLFLRALDTQHQWFNYHPLFSAFLVEQLRSRSSTLAPEIHHTAARWHWSQGNFEDALQHATACLDFELAIAALNVWSSRLIADAQLATVERWYARLPFVQVIEHLDLAIKIAYALIFLRRRQKIPPLLQFLVRHGAQGSVVATSNPDIVLAMAAVSQDDLHSAFTIIERVELRHGSPEGFAAFELSAAANLAGYRAIALGDFEAARDCLACARAYNDLGSATFSRGYTLAVTGVVQILTGELHRALPRYRDNMAEQQLQLADSFALAALASCYVWALYEANQLALVQAVFAQYHDIIGEAALPDFLVVAYVSAARTQEALGNPVHATEILDELESLCYRNGWGRLIGTVNWERSRQALVAGAFARAQAIASHFSVREPAAQQPWLTFSEDMEGAGLGKIRLAIHSHDFATAARALSDELGEHPARIRRRIKLLAFDALLKSLSSMHEASQQALRQALHLAETGGYVRVFVEEGPQLHRLLHEEYQSAESATRDARPSPSRQFLGHVLAAAGIELAQPPADDAHAASAALTSRERQILRYLAAGISNREMAERIFVSENTVKFHLKNIYSKLGVGTRVQAISAARDLGLIE